MVQQIKTQKEKDVQQNIMNLEYLYNLYGVEKTMKMIKENKQGVI